MFRDDASRRIALASALIILLIAAAFGVTIWRYQNSHGASNRALDVRAERLRADQAGTVFWRERESMNEYLLNKDQAILKEIDSEAADFRTASEGLGADVPSEYALTTTARQANVAFIGLFDANRHVAGTKLGQEEVAVRRLNAREDSVLGPLDRLQTLYSNEVNLRLAQAKSA